MNIRSLDDIYKTYRFEKKSSGHENIRVYTYTSGYFNNADIIPLNGAQDVDIDRTKKQFEELGYSTSIRRIDSHEDADIALFNGFFNIKNHKLMLEESYAEYCARCSHAIEGKYTYIPSNFFKQNDTKEIKSNVIQEIKSCLEIPSPQMIVLEAPAGFGKTTTVNELIHSLCEGELNKIPFVTELARNRQAQIFKYVLLDELDRQFPALKLDLVTHHIKKGNIILVIDGFDELLTKTDYSNTESVLIAAEPMLETMSQLLTDNAKVILTTRKTAIFSGDYFHEWIDRHSEQFSVTRYEICEPLAKEWLCETRLKKVKEKGLDLEMVPNPILLAWLRARSDEEFSHLVADDDNDGLIDKYFERLLEREKGRQKLYIAPKQQKEIFIGLTDYFIKYDISSEQKEYLTLFLSEKYGGLFEEIAKTYPPDERLTEEILIDKITNHAFLDRKVSSSLGFVNDFFFGYFLGECILRSNDEDWDGSAQFIELACSAFRARADEIKNQLWNKLNTVIDLQQSKLKFQADKNLRNKICRNYKFEIFEEEEFSDTHFGESFIIDSSLFNSCDFKTCTIYIQSMKKTNFVHCRFFGCTFVGDFDQSLFSGCIFSPELELQHEIAVNQNSVSFDDWELHVLRKFWQDGRSRLFLRRKISTLKMGTPISNGPFVEDAIQSLKRKGYLQLAENTAICQLEKINDIKAGLGR